MRKSERGSLNGAEAAQSSGGEGGAQPHTLMITHVRFRRLVLGHKTYLN